MKRPLVIKIWEDKNGVERVRIKSGNGRILFASEGYESGKAERAVDVLTTELEAGNYRIEK